MIELRLALVWAAGALFMLAGSWLMGGVQAAAGVTALSYAAAVLGSFVLFLLAGLCWISVAFALKNH